MKVFVILSIIFFNIQTLAAQTLQTVVNNGNIVTSPVILQGRLDLGESYDPTPYGAVQIARAVSQDFKQHLSFIRQGQMVYGLGFYHGTNVFAIQCGGDNRSTEGVFLSQVGNVGMGIPFPAEKLSVNGKIRAKEIKVETANWPDYVFLPSYKIPTLIEIEKYIKENGHLPGIPSAVEVEKNGVELGDISSKLLQKIEELTLHLIEKDKIITGLLERVDKLETRNK